MSSTSLRCAEDTPAAAPRRSNRKARSTLISNEIAALQRGPPAQKQTASPPKASAGFLETPPSAESAGRMGQNSPASREGIEAQGIARPDNTTEPAEGGIDVLSAAAPGKGDVAVRPSRRMKVTAAGRAYEPKGFQKKELLRRGEGTATIAGRNFEGVVEDRFHHALSPGTRAGEVLSNERIKQKMAQGQAVVVKRAADDKTYAGDLLNEAVRKSVVDKLVRGHYDGRGLLTPGKEGEKPHPVDDVRKNLLRNGTYLASDAGKLVEKVQSFLTKEQWKKLQAAG